MSFLVELPPAQYNPNAFANFNSASGDFDIDVARAMMWMSQLAYETHVPKTITAVSGLWTLSNVKPLIQPAKSTLPVSDTRGVIAQRNGATIIAFAGTDPLILKNWVSDFYLGRPKGDVHQGFEDAAAAVWDDVRTALIAASAAGSPIFITGHSLGAALAVVTADRARSEPGIARPQVYLYGCPRVCGVDAAATYNAALGPTTYRLVHGNDIVPTVPPPQLGFHHVGRYLACGPGAKFVAGQLALNSNSDEPLPTTGGFAGIAQQLANLVVGFSPSQRMDVIGRLSELLLPGISDHLPDRYYDALT
ncbi:lipase family protein [Bradyrhizobium rifense]|uniref:Lipase family protein n=1 Tax=Bradyrhizobium rifense TaxID=515499 RepID=A0A5D3KGE3_9BRAD|nr:lipase family protein [Bradyrhizobium rifense]TYL95634.1 lipase family protein [Bradyrhizobium rifense]